MDDIVAYVESLKDGYIPKHRIDTAADAVAVGRVRLLPADTGEIPPMYGGPTEEQVTNWTEHYDHVWPPEDYS